MRVPWGKKLGRLSMKHAVIWKKEEAEEEDEEKKEGGGGGEGGAGGKVGEGAEGGRDKSVTGVFISPPSTPPSHCSDGRGALSQWN